MAKTYQRAKHEFLLNIVDDPTKSIQYEQYKKIKEQKHTTIDNGVLNEHIANNYNWRFNINQI